MCCYNYSPEELPTHVPFLGDKLCSLAAGPEDESPTQHESYWYSWDSSLKSCPRCPLQRRTYPTLRHWRLAAIQAETLPKSRSGPSGEGSYPCSSKEAYSQEPYSQSPPPFRFLLESTSPSDSKMAICSAPRTHAFVFMTLPRVPFLYPCPQISSSATDT